MKSYEEIASLIYQIQETQEPAALATLVSIQGSSYRRLGARMIVTQSGKTAGGVSAGCLESDVAMQAQKVIQTGKPLVVTYDSQADDPVTGFAMGCGGTMQILIEPLQPHIARWLVSAAAKRPEPVTAVSVYNAAGMDILGTYITSHDDTAVLKKINDTDIQAYKDVIPPPIQLTLFGAGDDAIPLYNIAREMGWIVELVDIRSGLAKAERFPEASICVLRSYDDISGVINDNTAAVIMTHNINHDRCILTQLSACSLRYIGLLGSRQRSQKLLDGLKTIPNNLYTPAGLDIGAESPEEIALSIIAEMKMVLSGRTGRSLNDR